MKVLLIYPPWQFKAETPPLGLACLAAVLEKLGEDVKILDLDTYNLNTWEEELHNELKDNKFQIAGISVMTPLFTSALKVTQIIREVDPSIKIIMGGAHPTIYPNEILKNYNFVDIIVRGEGEETLAELIPLLKRETDLKDVKGISYRKGGEIIHNSDKPLIANLNSIPFPALHLLPINRYRNSIIPGKRMMTLISSRGCPFNCYFCFKGIFGGRFRARSAENIVEEIEQISSKYGINLFYFYDDTFTLNKSRVFKFCKLLKERNLRVEWSCVTRVDCVTPSMLLEMKKAGCYSIHYGVEKLVILK